MAQADRTAHPIARRLPAFNTSPPLRAAPVSAPGTTAPRWIALDVLRGLMALAVAVYHLSVWTQAPGGWLRNAVIVSGIYSVQGFFILSGLCFFGLHRRATLSAAWLRDFYVRRYLRLAPLFYLAIALNYGLGMPVDPRAGWFRFAENLGLCFALTHPNHALVRGGWSVGIEWLFYGAFPLLAWLTRRRVLVMYGLLVCAVVWAIPWTFGKVAATPTAGQFNTYVGVPNHAFLFLVGGVIADLRERVRWRLPLLAAVLFSALIGVWALGGQPEIVDHIEVMIGLPRVRYVSSCAAVVLLWSLVDPRDPTPPARSTSGAAPALGSVLGDLSYSVYLMHPFAWYVVSKWTGAGLSPTGQLLLGVGATLVLSALTYRFIERPAIGWGRRMTTRSGDRVPTPSAADAVSGVPLAGR